MVRPERVELPTFWFVARRSIQLSYGRTDYVFVAAAYRNFLHPFNMDFRCIRYIGTFGTIETLTGIFCVQPILPVIFLTAQSPVPASSSARLYLTGSSGRFYCEFGIKKLASRSHT